MYFWISAFDHRAIVLDKMHIVHWLNILEKIEGILIFVLAMKKIGDKEVKSIS